VHAERGEIEGCWGAEAAEADDQDFGLGDEGLARDGDGGEEELAVIAGRQERVGWEEDCR
jgi:hypothetical protein